MNICKQKDELGGYLVVCSGGMDSTVLLHWAMARDRVEAVTFKYGQNHCRMENAALRRTCSKLGVMLTEIDLAAVFRGFKSSLLGGEIPEGHYASENMRSTVVPFRNGIMLSIAAGLAESRGIGHVVLGMHGGDHFIYPDCRPGFVEKMAAAVRAGTGGAVRFEAPFVDMTKADIVRLGAELGVDFKDTYSCYKGGEKHCGRCGTCVERKEAFKLAGVEDPTEYEL